MEQFKVSESGIKTILNQLLKRIIPIYVILLIGIVWLNFDKLNSMNGEFELQFLLIFISLMLGAFVISSYLSLKRLKSQLSSYVLTINENEIIREQNNMPTIRHLKSDITEIIKNHNGSFTIKARSNKDVIGIPIKIENSDKLESLLNQIKPVQIRTSQAWWERFTIPLVIITIALMGGVYTSTNVTVVVVSGIILLSVFTYSLFTMYNNKNIDSKIRRWMFVILIPMISIIGRMVLAFSPINESNYSQILDKKEQEQADSIKEIDGELIDQIEINRKVKEEDAKDFENGLAGGIGFDKLDSVIMYLDKPDEVVLPYSEVNIEIDYPLDSIYIGVLKSTQKGFTRKELIKEISKRYHQIYIDEEATAKIKTIPIEKREDLINRNQTDGKYGIWGHDLSDLYLNEIEVYKTKDGKIIIRLNIDS